MDFTCESGNNVDQREKKKNSSVGQTIREKYKRSLATEKKLPDALIWI